MMPILNIGPLAIQLPGLLLLLGFWLGLSLAERHANIHNLQPNRLYNLVFIGLISGIIMARVTYVLRYPAIFGADPLSLISLNPGLLDLWGGAAGGILAMTIYGQRVNIKFWPTLDALTPLFMLGMVAFGFYNLASGSAFGAPTNLPWGIELWGETRHPTQIYQIIAALLILFALWPARKWIPLLKPGVYFLSFVALSALTALFLEAFRGDSRIIFGGIRMRQLIAWLLMSISLWGAAKLEKQPLHDKKTDLTSTLGRPPADGHPE